MMKTTDLPSATGWPARLRLVPLATLCAGLLAACQPSGNGSEPPSGDGTEPPAGATSAAAGQPAGTKPAAVDAEAQLDELVEAFAEDRRHDEDEFEPGELKPVSAEAFLGEIADNRALLEKVRAIDAGALSPAAAIDRKAMIGILESDIHTAEHRRIWENDGALYVPAGEVGRLLEPMAPQPPEERAVSLQSLLAKLPSRLELGKQNLRNPPERFTEGAIFKTKGTLASLKESAAVLGDQPTINSEAYRQTLDAAIAALEDYRTFLENDVLPRSTGSWAIGKENYDYILQHRWFLDADADSILARGKAAFEKTEKLAQQVAERIEPGKHWSEVYEHLKDEHPQADGIKAAYQKAIDAAQAFVKSHHIVTLPEGEHVVTVDTPPAMRRSSPFGTFQSVDPFGDGLVGHLVLTPIEDWMTPEQQQERLRSHHDAWIPIIAVHEAYPGHHVDALKTRENPRLLRKVVHEPIFSEGWGLFTEEMMYEQGFLTGDDVRLTQLRNRLWRAARVILDSSLHTGKMTFEEAVDFLAEKVRFERYAAELEVGMYTERPTYVLGYLIGMQEISAIRDDWIERYGEPTPPSEFYDPLLTVGALPPVLVRESLLGDDAAGTGRTGQ